MATCRGADREKHRWQRAGPNDFSEVTVTTIGYEWSLWSSVRRVENVQARKGLCALVQPLFTPEETSPETSSGVPKGPQAALGGQGRGQALVLIIPTTPASLRLGSPVTMALLMAVVTRRPVV